MSKHVLLMLGVFGNVGLAALYFFDQMSGLFTAYRVWAYRMKGSRAHIDPHYDLPQETLPMSLGIEGVRKVRP